MRGFWVFCLFGAACAAGCTGGDGAQPGAAGGSDSGSGGASGNGGASAGGSTSGGGASAGGASTGGVSSGGAAGSGGASSGGTSESGGASNGGASGSGGSSGAGRFPLGISADKRSFVDKNGAPFLVVGDSPWELIQNLSDADLETYLGDRESRGFDAVLVSLVEHKFTPHTPASADAAGNVPFSDVNDWTTTNAAYFDHAHAVVEKALSHGILVFLAPAYIGYGCGDEGWCQEMLANGVAKLNAYGAFVGQKFKDLPNVVWVEGGDHVPSTSGSPSELDVVNGVANGILLGDDGAHFHTAHWDRGHSSTEGPPIPWLDVDATYTNGAGTLADTLSDYGRDQGVRPSFLIEGYYEFEHGTPGATLRLQMYGSVLGGSSGFLYGSDPGWYLGVPNDGNPGWTFRDPGTPISWKTALGSDGAIFASKAREILEAHAWSTLAPDTAHSILTAGYDSTVLGASADRKLALAYFSTAAGGTVALSAFPGPVTATWIDPVSGATQAVTGSPLSNSGSTSLTPPGSNSGGGADWLVELKTP